MRILTIALLLMSSTAFAQPNQGNDIHDSDYTADIRDPWEGMNRAIFSFNNGFDEYILEPVSRGYHWLLPDFMEEGIHNFFLNLRFPSYLLSDVVQFKFSQALRHTGRFLINTTAGIGGLIDVAQHVGLPDHKEDFGIALAYHGVGPGPYLVLPFLGPSNVRDTVGTVVDLLIDPVAIFFYTNSIDNEFWVGAGISSWRMVDARTQLLEAIDAAKESSLDYYLFVQSAYYQDRRGLLYDGFQDSDDDLPAGADSVPNVARGAR